MSLASGTKLGPYEIQSLVGAGGMGEVYRAHDSRLNRTVAIKVLPASFSADRDRLQRFSQEARAAAALNHPNILSIFDIGEEQGAPYVVSELLEGETLRERLRNGALPVRRVIEYAVQVARGLAAAHEKGIVHRDLKPENLFLTNDGRVKILDFGLAKLTRPEAHDGSGDAPTVQVATEAGVVMGTAGYMSPEQVRGKPADHRSDIFSFGAILYEMISGKRAFHGETSADTMSAILKEEVPELSETARNVPPGLERIVRHCLEKHPVQRFQSAGDLAFDLEALTEISAGSKSGAQAAVQQVRGRDSRRQIATAAGSGRDCGCDARRGVVAGPGQRRGASAGISADHFPHGVYRQCALRARWQHCLQRGLGWRRGSALPGAHRRQWLARTGAEGCRTAFHIEEWRAGDPAQLAVLRRLCANRNAGPGSV